MNSDSNALIEECQELNLKQFVLEVSRAIATSRLADNQRDTLLEICVQMHRRYDDFSEQLVKDMETYFRSLQLQTEHARKRNTLRMLTELFIKGIFKEYRRIFKCLI